MNRMRLVNRQPFDFRVAAVPNYELPNDDGY
jgi:hypothetical protein